MGESRFRVPRRPQSVFLLPGGEGQDEGEGGLQQPSRDLLFEHPLPWRFPFLNVEEPNFVYYFVRRSRCSTSKQRADADLRPRPGSGTGSVPPANGSRKLIDLHGAK